ncbi:hypothetical protein U472_00025 [Orenia metallireducens]|uniref:Major facilitator superfamily (MFS) profile domain-containing protein n=1 Tax=Orenia metallireducens TaxID=1413210 RepID=A0A1C0ADF7_9FIRM|nr:MFS transporter [Orenia metallireducens]OCL28743.1 hypothetical protein U472_00025 [Orenia metallireducens]
MASKTVATFTVLLIASQSLTNILWGYLSDKYGHKLIILLSSLFNGLGLLAALLVNSLIEFYLVFILTGIALGGNKVSFMTIISEFCSFEERPTYIGITNTISGLTITIVSLIGGLLVDLINYELVFAISFIMVSIETLMLLTKVKKPCYHEF